MQFFLKEANAYPSNLSDCQEPKTLVEYEDLNSSEVRS